MFLASNGWAQAGRTPLRADASFRRYERLTKGGASVLLMDAPPAREDVGPFVRITRHLVNLGLSAPRVLAEDARNGFLLIEDFGDDTYSRLIAAGMAEEPLYRLAVDALIHLHRLPAKAVLPPDIADYNIPRLLAETALLPDWFLPAVRQGALDTGARASHDEAWRQVLPALEREPRTLVLRDFHVDNLMRIAGRDGLAACGILDSQDAVAGPAAYDLMSLLEDARRDVPEVLAAALRARYEAAIPRLSDAAERARFRQAYAVLSAQRHAKVIGIFTRLAVRDAKPVYLAHIPRVWRMLECALANPALGPVAAWFQRHVPQDLRRSPS